jgi:hypothetical protein
VKAQGGDLIYWVPPGVRGTLVMMEEGGAALIHRCPTAVLIAPTRRDQLDPLATGTCQFCGGKMP